MPSAPCWRPRKSRRTEVIVHSDLLLNYLQEHDPNLYLVSSTTKVLTEFAQLRRELEREEFRYVVPDFRLNRAFDALSTLSGPQKAKVEFLCNECCWFGCKDRKRCYEAVSRKNLGLPGRSTAALRPTQDRGTVFLRQWKTPASSGWKTSGTPTCRWAFPISKSRAAGWAALILEFLLYYMTRPECQLKVREAIYLDNMLDLF